MKNWFKAGKNKNDPEIKNENKVASIEEFKDDNLDIK